MSGAGSRRKGHDFERTLVQQFAKVFGEDKVRRGFQYRDGSDAPDVETPVFWVEAKRGQRTHAKGALAQAREASVGKGLWPIAVCKDDREPATVTLALDDFLDLVGEWWGLRSKAG